MRKFSEVPALSVRSPLRVQRERIYFPFAVKKTWVSYPNSSILDVWNWTYWNLFGPCLVWRLKWGPCPPTPTAPRLPRPKICFSSLQSMREETSFRMIFEKVKPSKPKLEIDDQELPSERKISSHYEEEEAPVKLLSTFEEHYHQIFYSAEILLWNSSDNGKIAFKRVAWRRFWSWPLAIPLIFSSDLYKFKLIKTFKNIADEK